MAKRILQGNVHSVFNIVQRIWDGETMDHIEKEIYVVGRKRAKEKGKCWGECESCGQQTVLVSEVHLCGPCCFGEAETYNGNW